MHDKNTTVVSNAFAQLTTRCTTASCAPDRCARHGAVHLETLAHDGGRDELRLGDFLEHLVVGGLVVGFKGP